MRAQYDVIVIGGGHAGVEAAWAAASVLRPHGGHVALLTMDPSRIGQMSCNPAIGGLAKGQMVCEIDALGGLMGRAIDATGIMFKMLNTSKGAAVRGPRAQADKYAYAAEVQRLISRAENIDVLAGTIDDLVVDDDAVLGVVVPAGTGIVRPDPTVIDRNLAADERARPVYPARSGCDVTSRPTTLGARAVVLTTGTFMRGLMHTGDTQSVGGRVGEASAEGISATLRRIGFDLGRLKTGTPPRLRRGSIDFDGLTRQDADAEPVPFSSMSPHALPGGRFPRLPSTHCWMTTTTAATHELIRANLDRAPIFSGQLDAECGPRYCPSIEDKVVRFPDRDAHHVFLEPESLHTDEVYANGISTSLPVDVQEPLVRAMPGCERAEFLRYGYAVEYDMLWPWQIDATCMAKRVRGLFPAGQINCTTGYEEAAAQGVVAGLNASRLHLGEDLVRIGRDQAYIGVMMDDLVTKTPREPYRMFTSRAEHRLLLRADNADERLTDPARDWGLIDDARWSMWTTRRDHLETLRKALDRCVVDGRSLRVLARRPEITITDLQMHLGTDDGPRLLDRLLTEVRYEGYIARQRAEVKRQVAAESKSIPGWLEYRRVEGMRSEAVEVLDRFRPQTFGQASRLAGVNPADLSLLAVMIRRGSV